MSPPPLAVREQIREERFRSHVLPFPDNHFDVVTLQYASRHLRVDRVFGEILRVLKPGGRFHHCDMLRPGNPLMERLYPRRAPALFRRAQENQACDRGAARRPVPPRAVPAPAQNGH
jgi:SAM-dependent methyltransferase